MKAHQIWLALLLLSTLCACKTNQVNNAGAPADSVKASASLEKPRTMGEILQAAEASEWRDLDPKQLLIMTLPQGDVVIELASTFSPKHSENIKLLVNEQYFDGLAIVRSQDNFVVQWGDPNADNEQLRKPMQKGQRSLPAEFTTAYGNDRAFTRLPDADGYAPEVGFSDGFAVGRDPSAKQMWPAHCYGVVGAGRDVDVTSGAGNELYVVTGHAPRQLDRNIAVVGRVVMGMEYLSTVARGPAPMGFYVDAKQRTTIQSIRLASSLPAEQQPKLQQLRTDSASFLALIEARRNRRDDWYKRPAGYIDLCNVPLPVRVKP